MSATIARVLALLVIFVAPLESQSRFVLSRSIPLPGVQGRIDHFAVDLPGTRLFVAALGNDSLEIVDLSTLSVVHSIHGLSEPQGVAFVSDMNKLYVANGGTGECDVFDGSSYALLKHLDLGGDADNMHYAPASRQLVVSAGDGLSFIDTVTDRVVKRVELPGHPEGFALEPNGSRVFTNIPISRGRLFVVDRERAVSVGQWRVGGLLSNLFSNFPLFLDDADALVLVGTRAPAHLVVMSADNGRAVADIGIDGDPDDVFYDAKRRQVYLSCGAGYIDIVPQEAPGRFGAVTRVPTADGARTSLWVPELDRLFVAVPRRGDQAAEVRIYDPIPKRSADRIPMSTAPYVIARNCINASRTLPTDAAVW